MYSSYSLDCIVCIYIVCKEYKKRIQMEEIDTNKYQQRLQIFSFTLLTLCPIYYFILMLWPFLCDYGLKFITSCIYLLSKILISFYQIARLQYCFSSQQLHSSKHAYAKTVFIYLYLHGISLIIMLIIDVFVDVTIAAGAKINPSFLCFVEVKVFRSLDYL